MMRMTTTILTISAVWSFLLSLVGIGIGRVNSFVVTTSFTSQHHQQTVTNEWESPVGTLSSRTRTTPAVLSPMKMIAPQQLGSFETLDITEFDTDQQRRVVLLDLVNSNNGNSNSDGSSRNIQEIDFEVAWDWQKSILEHHVERIVESTKIQKAVQEGEGNEIRSQFLKADDNNKDNAVESMRGVDTVIMLQHSPIYTLGTGSDEKFVLSQNDDGNNRSVPVVRMDRGGEVTYHGPGQITVYPILDLRSYKQDIHWYMRALEEAVLIALTKCGVKQRPERQDDITGIWIDNRKVAAVGIKCRKWISMHGVAINVEESSLSNFDGIVPCGLEGRDVGCINQFLDDPITVSDFAIIMKEAIEEVFQIELVHADNHEVIPL